MSRGTSDFLDEDLDGRVFALAASIGNGNLAPDLGAQLDCDDSLQGGGESKAGDDGDGASASDHGRDDLEAAPGRIDHRLVARSPAKIHDELGVETRRGVERPSLLA